MRGQGGAGGGFVKTAAAGPAVRAAGADRGDLGSARRSAVPLYLAAARAPRLARRRPRAHRRGMVDPAGAAAAGSVGAIRDYYRVEDEEGRRFWLFRAGLPVERDRRSAAALVCARPVRLSPMPLPPKAFNKLARTIGSGSAGPPGKARTPVFGAGPAGSPGSGPVYAELQVTSNFSFLRGASHPDELVVTAAALGHARDRDHRPQQPRRHRARAPRGEDRRRSGSSSACRLDLRDGASLLAYPQDRAAYGRLTPAVDPRQAARAEGRMPSRLRRCRRAWRGADRHRLAAGPARERYAEHLRRPVARISPAAPISPPTISIAATTPAASPASRSRRQRPGCRSSPSTTCSTTPRAAAAAGCRDLHPRALHDRRGRLSPRRQCRAPSEAARGDGAAVPRPRGRGRAHARNRRALPVQPRRAALRIPRGAGPRRHDAAAASRRAHLGGRRRAVCKETLSSPPREEGTRVRGGCSDVRLLTPALSPKGGKR